MSTTKPRLTITLEPVTALQLRRVSELTGNSQSSMVSEVLEQASPVFQRLIAVLEAAELAQQEMRETAVERLAAAQEQIEGQLGLILDEFDECTAPLLTGEERVSRRRRPRAQAVARTRAATAASTPLSNRGVRSDQETAKSASKSKAYAGSKVKTERAPNTAQKRPEKGAK